MKRFLLIPLIGLLLLGSCTTTVAKREKSLVLQAEALTLLEDKKYGQAVPLLELAVDLAPQESGGRYNLILALLANEQFHEAIALSDTSFALFPAHLEFLLAKAFAYRQMGALDEAFSLYADILTKDRGNFPLHATLMELALELGQTGFARERAQFLLSVHKEEARAFRALASLEGENSWYALVSSLMKEASTEDPKQPLKLSSQADESF